MRIDYLLLTFFSFPISSWLMAQDLDLKAILPSVVNETSGLIRLDNKLITHLDSDGANALFELDTLTGDILRTVYVSNASNIDWEDITLDDSFIYIADFGNNNGARTNLRVYKIAINDYLLTSNDSVIADTISFSYNNQTDFTVGSNNTDFDAEGIISYQDSLYIFSKNWLSNTCDVYALSKIPGHYSISKVDSFDSQGLITGASFDPQEDKLFLCGYSPPIPFVIRIDNFNGFPISNPIHQIVQVPVGSSVQIEAITSKDSENLWISSEVSVLGESSLMTLAKESIVAVQSIPETSSFIFPNPSNTGFQIIKNQKDTYRLYSLEGQLIKEGNTNHIDTSNLPPACYIVVVHGSKGEIVQHNTLVIKP